MPNGFKACSVNGCNGNADWSAKGAKGFCRLHYDRFCRHGDPLAGRTPEGEPEIFYRDTVLQYNGDDCITWPYARDKEGYGRMTRDGKRKFVHRLVCEDINGPPPTPEHQTAHSCGRGDLACVTKGHLSWKTPKENSEDKIIHGTSGRGEKNAMAKLTEAQALEILSLRGKEMTKATATRFGVSTSAIEAIQSGRNWACLSSNGPLPAAPSASIEGETK